MQNHNYKEIHDPIKVELIKENKITKLSNIKSVPRDYPITKVPLSPINIMLDNPEYFDEVIRNMCNILNGQLNVEKGYFIAIIDSETSIKVSGFRDTITNNVYIEFNRLEGCAFKFQKAFVEAKISIKKYIKLSNDNNLEDELKLVEEKLRF